MVVGERLRAKIGLERFAVGDSAEGIDVTVSIGIASLSSPEDTPEILLKRADRALYQAKKDGRNRVAAAA